MRVFNFSIYFLLLASTQSTQIIIDTQSGWQDTKGQATGTSNCGVHKNVIGGYTEATNNKMEGFMINKQFTFSQPETDISVQFDFLAIDKWDFQGLFVQINGYIVLKTTSIYRRSNQQECGHSAFGEQLYEKLTGSVQLPCATTQVVIQFLSRLDGAPSDMSFGITNVKITGNNRCPQNCDCCQLERPQLCTKCKTGIPAGSCVETVPPLKIVTDLQNFPLAVQWKDQSSANIQETTCNGIDYLGGYQGLPADYLVKNFPLTQFYDTFFVSFTFIEIDQWSGSVWTIMLNQQQVHSEHLYRVSTTGNNQVCGDGSFSEKKYQISFQYKSPASLNSLEIHIGSDCNNSGNAVEGYFGIRDLEIQAYASCKSDCLRCTRYQGNHKCLECRSGNIGCQTTELTPIITDAYGTNNANYQGWKKDQGSLEAAKTSCSGTNFAVGATFELSKDFTLSKPYYDFYLQLEILIIDDWKDKNYFVFVNDKLIYQHLKVNKYQQQGNICGFGSGKQQRTEIGEQFSFIHSTKSLTVTIRSSVPLIAPQSIGIRNLKIFGLGGCTDSECDQCLHEGSGNQKCIKCASGASSCVSGAFPFSQLGPPYSGWKGVGNVDLTEYDCSGIKMLGGLQTPYVYVFSKQFQYDVLIGQVSFSFIMYLMGVWSGDKVKVLINNEVAFESKHYFSDQRTTHFDLCGNIVGNAIDPLSILQRVENIHSMTTPSKTITFKIQSQASTLREHPSSNPFINALGILKIQLAAFNNCGNQCLGQRVNFECQPDKTCSPCSNDAECIPFFTNELKCRSINGVNKCVYCDQHSQCNGNPNGSYCILGECKPCQIDPSVCNSGQGEICRASDNICGQCTLDSDCKALQKGFDYCLQSTTPSLCVQCTQNQHCSLLTATPFCNANKCSKCDPSLDVCKDNEEKPKVSINSQTVVNSITTTSVATIILGADPTLIWGMINLMQMFFYLLFMNVKYPKNFQEFLQIFSAGRLEFLPQPLSSIFSEEEIEALKLESPPNFYNNDFSGLFLQSCGGILFACLVSIMIYALAKLLTKCCRRGKFKSIPQKLVSDFEWSGFYRLCIVSYFEFMFGTLLQIQVLRFSQFTWAFSSILSLIILTFNLILPIIIYKLIKSMDDPNQYLQKYGVFFEDYDTNRAGLKYTLIILLGRRVIQSLAVVFFYNFPFLQNLVCWVSYFIMMNLYFIKLPHNQVRLNFIETLSEIGFFVIHSLISVLTIYFREETVENAQIRDNIGIAIISMVCMAFFAQAILVILEQYHVLKDLIKKIKLYYRRQQNKFPMESRKRKIRGSKKLKKKKAVQSFKEDQIPNRKLIKVKKKQSKRKSKMKKIEEKRGKEGQEKLK